MKAIIYAGITLFSAAGIYGVTDYYSTKSTGGLNSIYIEETVVPDIKTEPPTAASPAPAPLKKETAVTEEVPKNNATGKVKKIKINNRVIRLEDFSRGRIVRKVTEAPITVQAVKEEKN